MKKNSFFFYILALSGLMALVKNINAQPAPATPAFVSASKTSFNEVTSQLDPGGNFYLYLGTAQWLDGLSGKVSKLRQTFMTMPDLKDDDRTNVDKAFNVVTHLIMDSGIEDVSGVGMSSIEIEKGIYRNKALLHHYPGDGTGFLWKLSGGQPHALTGLDLLPTDTALAIFSDVDLPQLWSVIKDEAATSGFPQAQDWVQQLPAEFEKNTQVNWDLFLNSLGGEFGLVLTLDESNNIPIPLPSGLIQIPSPGLMIVVKVNDDTIFNRIDLELKKNPQVVSTDTATLKMRTMPSPLPMFPLNPTAASSGGYLFIATSDALIQEALAVKSGQQPGLKSTDEFQKLSQNIPDHGNQFTFMSRRFGQTMADIQKQVVMGSSQNQPAISQWIQSLMNRANKPAFGYSVGVNTPDGCLTIGNSSQSFANMALLPAVAVPALLAAVAVPNFVKARSTSQENACINNLRQLDAAKNEWALEKGKKDGDVPTQEDLLPYLRRWPVCPQGGTYTIGAIGENPTCSIPGHVLP
jgi:hypothetical protein